MSELHQQPGCTEYFHDLLDIIHDDMIVVLSKDKDRIRSEALLRKIKVLHSKVTDFQYGSELRPRVNRYDEPIAVKTELKENAAKRFNHWVRYVHTYEGDGDLREAKTQIQMEQVDEQS